MRITAISWLIVLAGAVTFGGGIVALAHVLPSDDVKRDAASYASGADTAPPQVHAPDPAAAGKPAASATLGEPPASRRHASPAQLVVAFDFHPLDPTMRDRYGNPPKRDATPDELASIAAAHDVIVDDLRWQPDGAALNPEQIAAMKTANPRLRVLRYLDALTNNDGPILNIAPDDGVHGSWFLRDGSGDFVRAYGEVATWNRKPSYALDPSSIDVRNTIGVWARQFARLGYDGVLLDGATSCASAPDTTCAPATLLSAPLNKTTNRPYTDADWLADTQGLIETIRHTAPNTQIFLVAPQSEASTRLDADGIAILAQ